MFKEEDFALSCKPYLCTSSNLLDQFMILGFFNEDKIEIKDFFDNNITAINNNEVILNTTFTSQINMISPQSKNFDNFKIETIKPTVLSVISFNNNETSIIESSNVVKFIFPENPKLYYVSIEKIKEYDQDSNKLNKTMKSNTPENYKVIFFFNSDTTDTNTKNIIYGFSYVFYEKLLSKNQIIFIPKAFCFLSTFPFFTHYHTLAKEIHTNYISNQIPIEIILYNIVNYSPAPIKHSLNLSFFPENFYKSQINGFKKYDLLSGYPLLDLNFAEIFNILSLDMILKIFIFNLLEIDMLFFSINIEMLNFFMYLFYVLNYPCNDSMYLWHILSVSKDELTNIDNDCPFIGKPSSAMLGVNCAYDEEIDVTKFSHQLFIVDLDKKDFQYKVIGKETKQEAMDNEAILYLLEHITTLFSDPLIPVTSKFDENLRLLYQKMEVIYNKVSFCNKGRSKAFIPEFFEVNESISQQNKLIQEIFYSFILNLIKPIYASFSLDIDFKDNRDLSKSFATSRKVYPNKIKEKYDWKETENCFYEFFSNTIKFTCLLKNFLCSYTSLDCLNIALFFTEEFLSYHNTYEDEYAFRHFNIIDSFYQSQEIEHGDNDSICNYNQLIKKTTRRSLMLYSDQYISFEKTKLTNLSKIKYELNNTLLYQYSNILKNIEDKDLNLLFPSEHLMKSEDHIVSYFDIPNHIEKCLAEYKQLTFQEYISFSIIIFYTLILHYMKPGAFIAYLKVVLELLHKQSKFMRKYCIMLISIYYFKANQLKQSNEDNSIYIIAYHLIIELLDIKKMYPNYELALLIMKFADIDDSNYETISTVFYEEEDCLFNANSFCCLNCNESTEQDSKIIEPLNNSVLLEYIRLGKESKEVNDQSLYLWKNICRDGVKKKAEIYEKIDCGSYEGDIIFNCDKCDKEIMPIIKYPVNSPIKPIETPIYSPLKIYNGCNTLFNHWIMNSMQDSSLNQSVLQKILINLFFYQSKLELKHKLIEIPELFM